MKKEQKKELKAERLEVGDKLFYYDVKTLFDVEEVISINKAEKTVTLTNNAVISRYPNLDDTFSKINIRTEGKRSLKTKATIDSSPVIKRLTPELAKLGEALLSKKKIANHLFSIHNYLQKIDNVAWDKMDIETQEKLIKLAKALEEGMK